MTSARDYTPDQVMGAISKALQAQDLEAAADLIRALAVIDPDSADTIAALVRRLARRNT